MHFTLVQFYTYLFTPGNGRVQVSLDEVVKFTVRFNTENGLCRSFPKGLVTVELLHLALMLHCSGGELKRGAAQYR